MRWFGESWGAPVCRNTEKAPTPDVLCGHGCGHDIRRGDNGVLLQYDGAIAEDGMGGVPQSQVVLLDGVPYLAYHLVCLFDEIGVRGLTHQ
jgi:hypothetical protein